MGRFPKMRHSLIIVGVAVAGVSVSAAAQQGASPPPGAPADPGGDVRSQAIGSPGSLNDPIAAYEQQRSLNNLPGQKGPANSKLGHARAAKATELAAGATVNDNSGVPIATIQEVDPDGVVVAMGTAKVKIPAEAFGHNNLGLLLDMSKAQFEQVVAKANAPS